ncbi:MAG: DeoR/GlpR transcriptional regulator, partial [Peptococcaceae bacterium]|nr:DeoR/GlpR transcriptional regulator [Peptococcaceae bacterium]
GFNVDKLFLAATGLDLARGLSTANLLESSVKRTMLRMAKMVIVVAHSEKMGQVYYHSFAQWDKIDMLITDSRLPATTRLALTERGVKVTIAELGQQ